MKRKTHEEFVEELHSKFPTLDALEEYRGLSEKLYFKCNECGSIWKSTPRTILYKSTGCKKCARKRRAYNQTKTYNEFVNEMKIINENITIIGIYINSKIKLLVKCEICNHEWEATPSNLLRGKGCPNCRNINNKQNLIMSHDDFMAKFNKLNSRLDILTKYDGMKRNIKVRCLVCGKIYSTNAEHILKGQECACLSCDKISKSLMRTNSEFIQLVKEKNPSVCPIEEYKGSSVKILFECLVCKHRWKTIPNLIISGYGCPVCGKSKSKGEVSIAQILDKNNILYDIHYRFRDLRGVGNGLLSYDFYLQKYNLLIEYQGCYHDGTAKNQSKECFKKQQEHDRRKREYANDHKIKLLEIWYYDYKNIEEILNNTLRPVTSIVD